MAELDRALRELGGALEFPATPELATAVGERLRVEPFVRRPWTRRRRTLVLALAVTLAALLATLAIPQARSALLRFLHLDGVSIERVEELPRLEPRGALDLGVRVSLAEAESFAGFRPLVPEREGYTEPDAVFSTGREVTLLYGTRANVRLLITEFRDGEPELYVKKVVTERTRVEEVSVGGGRGYWVAGDPHAVRVGDSPFREAANVLLWEREGLTLRLEAQISRAEALAIAESMR